MLLIVDEERKGPNILAIKKQGMTRNGEEGEKRAYDAM